MFKKLFFIGALLSAMSVSAQNAVKTSGIFDNTYMKVGIGASTNLKFNPVFPINTAGTIGFGKWVNPKTALELEGNVLFGSADYDGGRFNYATAVSGLYLGASVKNDLFNLFKQKNRKFTLISEVGAGWLHTFNSGNDQNDLAAKTGLAATWNVSKTLSIFAEPTIYWNLTPNNSTPKFSSNHAQFAVEVGIVYNFKNHDGSRGFTYYNIGALNDSINAARKLAHDKEVENATLYKALKEKKDVHDTVYVNVPTMTFAKASATLANTQELDIIQSGKHVTVEGYASPEGNKSFNEKLSKARAQAVADYLTSKGVIVDEVKGYGAPASNSNRIVIIKVK